MAQSKRFLSRDALKYLAVLAMLLDHIAHYFLPFSLPLAQIFHTAGRITAPIMCFFLVEGYRHTRSVGRYLLRLLLFGAAAQLPWWWLHHRESLSFNMLITLFFCLLMLHAEAKIRQPVLRVLAVAACIGATYWCDWHFYAPLWCLGFQLCRENRTRKWVWFSAVALYYFVSQIVIRLGDGASLQRALLSCLFCLGVFLAVPLLECCNGEKGKLAGNKLFDKWFFYVFYPLHLGVIAFIKWKTP